MGAALARRALALLHREVGARAGAGRADAGIAIDRLAALVEADPDSDAALEAAVEARRRQDPLGPAARAEPSARRTRAARLWEARRAVGDLTLAGQLAADGPDRVCLPGFGGSTWRAVALLRPDAGGEASEGPRRWAAAVAAEPAADLGAAAPAFLRDLRPDPRLARPAARLLLLEAVRQELRHALIEAERAIGAALEGEYADGASALAEECAALSERIAELDGEIARAWDEGERLAVGYARPG